MNEKVVELNETEEEPNPKQQLQNEISYFKEYIEKRYGLNPEVLDEYLDEKDYIKMIVNGFYNQYVVEVMKAQQQQQKETEKQKENQLRK